MKTSSKLTMLLTSALAMAALLWTVGPLMASDTTTGDSEEVSKLLSDSKAEAAALYSDANDMERFTASKLSWESHAQKLEQIRTHVNKCGELVQKLNDIKHQGSPWQQQAVERITPLLSELASNTTTTIEHMKNNRNKLQFPPYPDYLTTNSDLAKSLSELVADYVSYGKTKDRFERLNEKLEVPEP
jgi:hypothetical protein